MNTYYTKCGRTFEKSTKADTTGYHIAEENGVIADQECADCPFPIDVKEGWGDTATHKRWECRAGSRQPNYENEYSGRADDKCTLQISSIDHDFCEAVIAYAQGHPDLGANYTQDRADCRRVVSVSCSQNKKGMAAKQELIDKFFPQEDVHGPVCGTCYHATANGRICIAGEIEKRIRPTDPVCEDFIDTTVHTEFPLTGVRKCRVCGCTDDHACPGGCSWVEEDLCSRCAETEHGPHIIDGEACYNVVANCPAVQEWEPCDYPDDCPHVKAYLEQLGEAEPLDDLAGAGELFPDDGEEPESAGADIMKCKCPWCGDMIPAPLDIAADPAADLEAYAMEHCTCEDAQVWQEENRQRTERENLEKSIDNQLLSITEMSGIEESFAAIKTLCLKVYDYEIDSFTFKPDFSTKITVKRKDGSIVMERTDTLKQMRQV